MAPASAPAFDLRDVSFYGLQPEPTFAAGASVFVKDSGNAYMSEVHAAYSAWDSAWAGSDLTPSFGGRVGDDTITFVFDTIAGGCTSCNYFCGAGDPDIKRVTIA